MTFPVFQSCQRLRWLLLFLLVVARSAHGVVHFGIDFLDESIERPPGLPARLDPFPLDDANNNLVTQGALDGVTVEEFEHAITLAIEDAFRAIDTGEDATTVAIAIHEGSVPVDLDGQRVNVAIGQSADPNFALLGQAKLNAVIGNDFQQDQYAAVAYADELDRLGDDGRFVVYDQIEKGIYAIAGTAAHEMGHVLGAVHIATSANDVPPPLLSIEALGLPTSARFAPRYFSTSLPADNPNAMQIARVAGTVTRGDLNFDGTVDSRDGLVLFANWGSDGKLYQQGDASGDHFVDAADAAFVLGRWTGDMTTYQLPEPASTGVSSAGRLWGMASVVFLHFWQKRRRPRFHRSCVVPISDANDVN